MRPINLIILGFFMVLTGAVLPFLMVIQLVESTFLLNFISYTASVVGLFLGVIGSAMYLRYRKQKEDWHDYF